MRRIRFISLSVLVMLCGSALAQASDAPTYYLALGDSLAQGVQWSPTGDVLTNHGYADDLYALLRFRISGLQLAKLGCPGETTSSMVTTGPCTSEYETNFGVANQLAAAEAFMAKNKVALITLDIGANDIDKCVSLAGVDFSCASSIVPGVTKNLTMILEALRAATPDTPIIAMNYYDPFLAAWTLLPVGGQLFAQQSLVAADGFNTLLESIYGAKGVPVADVAQAFQINNFTPIPFLENLPLNVFLALNWTWMEAPPPFGPDIHANDFGYAVIAGAFAEQIRLHSTSWD
jgi:lysophospholipase L1-like esterase